MSLIHINRNPSRRELWWFGLFWLVIFALISAGLYRRSGPLAAGPLLAVAVLVPVIGWIRPGFTRLVYLGMAYATFPIGLVVMHIVMALVYYLVMTPVGLLLRCFGHDPMQRRFDRSAETYWAPRQDPEKTDQYFRQF